MVREVGDEKEDRGRESRDHAGAMRARVIAPYEKKTGHEQRGAYRIQGRVDGRQQGYIHKSGYSDAPLESQKAWRASGLVFSGLLASLYVPEAVEGPEYSRENGYRRDEHDQYGEVHPACRFRRPA